jgi:phosphonate transport system substrate-binding protein
MIRSSVEGAMMIVSRCLLLLALLVALPPSPAGAVEPLRLGIYPLLEVTEVVRRFTPLARYLEAKTGRPVIMEVSKDYQDHIDKTGAEAYDISYLGPASYIQMVREYGLKPILARLETNNAPSYRGAIIVRQDSPLAGLGDLKGKRFAFGDKGSTMGYVVPRHLLWKAGLKPEDLAVADYLKNQEDVAMSVLAGHFDAGAVREQIFEQYRGRGLRVLAWSPHLSEHLFAARASTAPGEVESLRAILYGVSRSPGGGEVLKSIQRSVTALIPAADSDYDSLRTILSDLDKAGLKP